MPLRSGMNHIADLTLDSIGVVNGVIVGANPGAFVLALCTAANENDRADREWNRGDPVRGHSAIA